MNTLFASKLLSPEAPIGKGLLSAPACDALGNLASSVAAKSIAEVGSWYGLGSTPVLARSVGPDGVLVCVDTWPHPRALPHFMANIARAGVADRIVPLRTWSQSASQMFLPGAFDLVFIDGGHSYDCVLADIRAWFPLVRVGGVLCGDDYNYPDGGVSKAVNELLPGVEVVANRIWVHRVNLTA
ncbi:MAG: class I SAM-dependent methyltransferase [Verrucomicrobia bacterium]|nr:class I SAM-dependent methyltransferase [Verrucomicrobiota bacterium]